MATEPNASVEATHILAFFAEYPDFEYNATAPVWKEFNRLTRYMGWNPRPGEDPEYGEARSAFAAALGQQFSTFYGSDVNDINAWQALCTALGVEPIPDSLGKCRKLVKSTHVNLVDFIDSRITGEPIRIFLTEKELRRYTQRTHKIFPKESAKESGVLKYLLRRIYAPRR
ncbi:hypothetical protein JOM56_002974 [Amanita muscaria]